MAEQKKEEFLDDIEESELNQDDLIDIDAEAAELEKLDEVTAERDDYRDRFMRALADAENARKRADKDRKEAENYGGSKLARDLLPIYDNMKRAVDSITEDQKDAVGYLIEGVELTMRELLNVFSKHGIKPISPDVGEYFDPHLHEGMFVARVPGTKVGEIIEVSSEGFMLYDRLLRPAHVGVSSNS